MRGQGRVYRPTVRRKGGVLQETSIWWLDYSLRGRRHQESSHMTRKTDAQKLLRERMADREAGRLVGPSPDRVTFQQLRELVERQYELDGRRSLGRIQIAFDHLATFFGTKDETGDHSDRVVDITPTRVDAYTTQRLEAGAARATVNREVAALRRGFRLAVEKGMLATMPRLKVPKEANARSGFFEAEDFHAVLAELPAHLRGPMQFMYLTGWRSKTEVFRLTWANVDFNAGVVRLDVGSTKNDDGRTFPFGVLPELETVLTEAWAARDGLFVFHRRGRPIRDCYEAGHNACKRAAVKVVDGREVVVRPQLVGRIPHDFRRTAVRNLERAGVSRSVAMKLTGHKTESVYRRYAIVVEQDLREGVEKLARGLTNGKQAGNISASSRPDLRVSSSSA